MELNPRPEKPPAPWPASTAVDKMEKSSRPPKPLSLWPAATAERSDPLVSPTSSSWTPAAIMERLEQKAKMGRSVSSCPPATTNDVAPEIPPISWPSSMDELDFAARLEMPFRKAPSPPLRKNDSRDTMNQPVSPLSPTAPWSEIGETATVVEMIKSKASGKRPVKPNTSWPPSAILDKLVSDIGNQNPEKASLPWPPTRTAQRVDSKQVIDRPPSTSSHHTEPRFTIERPRSSTSHKSMGRPPSTASHKTDPRSGMERRPSVPVIMDTNANGKKALMSWPSTSTLLDKTSPLATPERQPSSWLPPAATPKLEPTVPTLDRQPAVWPPSGVLKTPDRQPTSRLPPTALQKMDPKDLLGQPAPPPDRPLPQIPPTKNSRGQSLFSGPASVSVVSLLHPSGLQDLKIIGVEEHIAIPHLMDRFPDDSQTRLAKEHSAKTLPYFPYSSTRLADVSDQRIKDMDDNGIAFQIISRHAVVNPLNMESGAGTALTRQLNDELKWAVDENPKRFAALAELPFQAPDLAIRELRRCVLRLGFVGVMLHGTIGSKFLDDPIFDDLLSSFEELDVPLFLHPGTPPRRVMDTYYSFDGKPDLNPDISALLAGPGFGWHNEVALHILRLAISGTLDRHPNLKLIVGHQGETLPTLLSRFDTVFNPMLFGLERPISETLRKQVWIAISGLFSVPVTMLTIQTWGVDKVLFANGYPLVEAGRVPDFVRRLGECMAPEDLRKVCQTNAEGLFKFRADECGRTRSNRKWTMIL